MTKLIHSVSARNVEEMFVTKSFTVAHEVEALVIVSQPDENHSNADGIELEHARNGKISMRSPSSNATIVIINIIIQEN